MRAVSWTPGTNGTVQGPVLVVEPPAACRGRTRRRRRRRRRWPRRWRRRYTPEQLAAIENPGAAPPPCQRRAERRKPVTQADLDAYLRRSKTRFAARLCSMARTSRWRRTSCPRHCVAPTIPGRARRPRRAVVRQRGCAALAALEAARSRAAADKRPPRASPRPRLRRRSTSS